MRNTKSQFDNLPEEIVRQILEECAVNGALARTATRGAAFHLVNRRFYRIMKDLMPPLSDPKFKVMERVICRADTAYHKGEWLQITFVWRRSLSGDSEKLHRLTVMAQHMSDRDLKFWVDILPKPTKRFDICFEAPPPSRDKWGVFLMLYAKAADAFEWVFEARNREICNKMGDLCSPDRLCYIQFEGPSLEAQNFWGCRVPNMSDDICGQDVPSPHFYEYILCAAMERRKPYSSRYDIDAATFSPPLESLRSSLLFEPWFAKVIGQIPHEPTESEGPPTWAEESSMREIRKQKWLEAGLTMADDSVLNIFNAFMEPEEYPELYYEEGIDNWYTVTQYNLLCLIFSQHAKLESNFRIYLDNHDDRGGGPAAMTRLHRFKTIWKPNSDKNFFSLTDHTDDDEYSQPFLQRRFQLINVVDEVTVGMSELCRPPAAAQGPTVMWHLGCPTLAGQQYDQPKSLENTRQIINYGSNLILRVFHMRRKMAPL